MNISKISVKRPTLVVVIFTILLFLGFAGYKSMKYELMPPMTAPAFIVLTKYPGAAPAEVENDVTKKLEGIISSVENIDHIQSTSYEGMSMIGVSLKMSANMDNAVQDAQRRINAGIGSLPNGIMQPVISKISMSDLPVMKVGVTSNLSTTEFYNLVKYTIQPELSRIKGVAEVSLFGGNEREVKISLNPEKLKLYNLSSEQVLQAIQTSNTDFPAGKIKDNNSQTNIRMSGKFKSIEDIKNVVINSEENGADVLVKDVAEVLDVQKESTVLNRINGMNSIGISILKQTDANAVEVCHKVSQTIAKMEKDCQTDQLKFTVAFDSSDFTEKAANSVMDDLMFAVLLVALVMLVFLHGIRNAFIVMIAIPLSIISSFIGMYLLDYSLNIMTLLAMSLVIGILVDDAIVVLENIYRHMEMGKNRLQATLDGRSEISFTAVAITLVDVVVFLPIGLSTGFIGPLIAPFAMVVVVTTLLSLFVAFTAIPLLASRFAKVEKLSNKKLTSRFFLWVENEINKFSDFIQRLLIKAINHKFITFATVTLLFIISVMLIPAGFVGTEAFSLGDAGECVIQVEMPKDASLKETNLKVLEIEKIIRSKPEVKSVFTSIGATDNRMEANSSNKAEIDVKLVDKEFRDVSSNVYANQLKNELRSKIIGAKITAAVMNPMFGSTDDSPIQLIVMSSNSDSLAIYSTAIQQIVQSTTGTSDVKSSLENANNEISVELDKKKMARLGLNMSTVGSVLSTAFSGNTDEKFADGSHEYDIDVVYDEFNRRKLDDVANLTFINSENQQIKLSQFATLGYKQGYSALERYDKTSSTTIQSQVLGRSSGDVGDEIRQKIETMKLPSNVSVHYAGDMEMQDDAFGTLGFALLTAIFLVYLIMVALYESYLYPFVLLFTIPLAIIGAIFGLALAKQTLNVFSMVGMIMLIGLVAKNAILVVDFTTHLIKQGKNTAEALLEATKIRLRPVLMTTMAMIIGLLPIALASGAASEWKNGIAWALIGGLTSSMFLTLIIVPIVFLITENIKSWVLRLFSKQSALIKLKSL
ncbi:MAG TPA: efflux RND transporter permease subunit [Ignavibacteriaceae bacterium]|nr:efflux RND transporter permease subunit [Ignavibacteriaceae bacterium]